MAQFLLRRFLVMVATLWLVYTIVFFVAHATPGSPWDRGVTTRLDPQVRIALDEKFGLNDPLPEQYVRYIANALQGDLGPSFRNRTQSVNEIIAQFLPVSMQLGAAAMAFAILFGLLLGGLSALRAGSIVDRVIVLGTTAAIAIPTYVIVAILIYLLALQWKLIPTSGWDGLFSTSAIVPVIGLAIAPTAAIARYFRSSLLETMRQDYVRTARAKGLNERSIMFRHMARNALLPILTVAGVYTSFLIVGSFFVESMLGIPGLGRYFVLSIGSRDYPVIIGTTMVFAVILLIINFLVDVGYAILDPRVRDG